MDDRDGEPGPVHPYVEALTGLPGVEHVAVVDISGQHVLGEWGGPAGSADPLLARAREAADRTGRRELEDVVSTTPAAFHLSRLVLAGPGHPESVWVALRVDRAQGSLPWSRAALAGLDGPTGAPVPRIPAPREEPSGGPVVPSPRIVPPPPVPLVAPAPAVPAVPAAPAAVVPVRTHVTLTARAAAPAPVAPPPPDDRTAETPLVEVPTTVELRLPAPPAPEPEPPAAEPERRSSFAPVLTVAPPPSPVPDDGTTEEPAPMPAPVVYAPDPVEEPRAADEVDADEPRVMRRLIHGLRRRT
ncbi:hypothetical protein Acsp07_17990 [Actinomycetospora sp. NBRC 106378]|nr:hypothetical protein Acsp07_17990 [Actinomycetospora sp. NBRC 106378]